MNGHVSYDTMDGIEDILKQPDDGQLDHLVTSSAAGDLVEECGLYEDGDSRLEGDSGTDESDDESDGEEGQSGQEVSSDTAPEGRDMLKNGDSESLIYFQTPKEGMATCENCGRVGVKHAFYSKEKKFCSLACQKTYMVMNKDKTVINKSKLDVTAAAAQKKTKSPPKSKSQVQISQQSTKSFDWSTYLDQTTALAAPVSCFKHCVMSDSWDNITYGMKVEVLNRDCDLPTDVYWIATVINIAGYLVLLRYEGFGNDPSHDFWINLCTQDVHPVGWCATNGKPLVPPSTIQNKYADWKDFLVKRLTGSRTLPNSFYGKMQEGINSSPLKPAMRVEVVDRMCVSAMKVARIEEFVGGRLRLKYEDPKLQDSIHDEFWCHCESPLVHPVGWSQLVGHKLHSSAEYKTQSLNKAAFRKYDELDSTPDMFPKTKDLGNGLKFYPGMKLEAIDPLNLSTICVATVMKVLRNNYLMIGIDGSMAENGSDWFCYHATSPCIFPVGFCEINGLDLTAPRGHKGEFRWFDYLKQTGSIAAPVKLFDTEIPKHGYKVGMKLEAVDLMEPRLICVGTVTKVVGRLLRLHFDGWEVTYDQWVDCRSADIYPVGWCEMVNYRLEGPKTKDEELRTRGLDLDLIYETPRPAVLIPKKKKVPTATLR